MKKMLFLFSVFLLSGMVKAQTITGGECMTAGGSAAFAVSYPEGTTASDFELIEWTASGGIDIISGQGSQQVIVGSKNGTTYDTQYSRWAKGRLHVALKAKETEDECGRVCNPYFYADKYVYKSFGMPDNGYENAIVGPECVVPGDSVTYSVAPWVSLMLGVEGLVPDSYFWTVPAGARAGNLYYSADKSSITFVVGEHPEGKVIECVIGQCNVNSQTPLTLTLNVGAADPAFNKDLANYCLPYGTERDTLIVTNAAKGVTYEWDLRSWTVEHQSDNGDTIVYKPLDNAQTIKLNIANSCKDQRYTYDISRRFGGNEEISTAQGACLAQNTQTEFKVGNIPMGDKLEWSVSGTGWSITDAEKIKAQPKIVVGTGTGVVKVKSTGCDTTTEIEGTFAVKPATPTWETWTTCVSVRDEAIKTFAVAELANVTGGYEWTIPNGWQIVGSDNQRQISVKPNGKNGGRIYVAGIGCEKGSRTSKYVYMGAEKPDSIKLDCANVGIEGTGDLMAYTTTLSAASQTYEWSIPTAFGTIERNGNTYQPTINMTGNEGTYVIKVRALNGTCGATDWTEKTVTAASTFGIATADMWGIYLMSPIPQNLSNLASFAWYKDGNFYSDTSLALSFQGSIPDGEYEFVATFETGCKERHSIKIQNGVAVESFGVSPKKSIAKNGNVVNGGQIVIYPNPTETEVTLQLNSESESVITLLDMNGKTVMTKVGEVQNERLDVSHLASGTYVVIVVQDGKFYNAKLIKK